MATGQEMHERGLVGPIGEAVMSRGIPYAGVSAGANEAALTMQTTNDMPITMVPSYETLGLVPFQINPTTQVESGSGRKRTGVF